MEPLITIFADFFESHPVMAILSVIIGSPTMIFLNKVASGLGDHVVKKLFSKQD